MTAILILSLTAKIQTALMVQNYLEKIGVQHSEIITAQAILETGWFKCDHCSMDHNNLFGFYYKGKYLEFETWEESCDYYLKHIQSRYKGGNYYSFLNCMYKSSNGCIRYAQDPEYTNKLKSIVKRLG